MQLIVNGLVIYKRQVKLYYEFEEKCEPSFESLEKARTVEIAAPRLGEGLNCLETLGFSNSNVYFQNLRSIEKKPYFLFL